VIFTDVQTQNSHGANRPLHPIKCKSKTPKLLAGLSKCGSVIVHESLAKSWVCLSCGEIFVAQLLYPLESVLFFFSITSRLN